MDRGFFAGKRILVMGLGRFGGGLDSVIFAARLGREVIVTDLSAEADLAAPMKALQGFSNIRYHLGGHQEEDFGRDGADIIVVNPAVTAGQPVRPNRRVGRAAYHLATGNLF